ncbi:MAG: response regulator [Chloroflexota bacterium]
MMIKVLIVDPDIAFAIPIKRALERAGDYTVNVFATGKAAIEAVRREPQDIAILDFNIDDLSLNMLIKALRAAQAGLFILTSPRSAEDVAMLPSLDVQGSITKPYAARQLGPVIREAMAAKQRLAKKEAERRASNPSAPNLGNPKPPTASLLQEPALQPDDTFFKLISQMASGGSNVVHDEFDQYDTFKWTYTNVPSSFEEPEVPEDATIRDLVSGQTPTHSPRPDHIPEIEPPAPYDPEVPQIPDAASISPLAMMALSAAQDDTMPMEDLTNPSFLAQIEQVQEDILSASAAMRVAKLSAETDAEYEQQLQDLLTEPEITSEDTHPSERLQGGTAYDTQAAQGIVQEVLEQQQQDEDDLFDDEDVPPIGDTQPAQGIVQEVLEQHFDQADSEEAWRDDAELESDQSNFSDQSEQLEQSEQIESPLPTAFQDSPAPSEEPVATLAVQLTQLTVSLAAQATLVIRGQELIASAGQLTQQTVDAVIETINSAWPEDADRVGVLVRYLHFAGEGDYLLYATPTADTMVLSMLFPAEAPLGLIRKQAKELMQALESVPESSASEAEVEAATTLVSRPTDLRPPDGLRAAAGEDAEALSNSESGEGEAAAPRAEGPYASYAFVWLPQADELESGLVELLPTWIGEIASAHLWHLDEIEIQPTYVITQVDIPANETPTATVETLLHETAARAENDSLWANAYYIVAPSRPVTPQEIASFREYQRDAQNSA